MDVKFFITFGPGNWTSGPPMYNNQPVGDQCVVQVPMLSNFLLP